MQPDNLVAAATVARGEPAHLAGYVGSQHKKSICSTAPKPPNPAQTGSSVTGTKPASSYGTDSY